MASAVRCHTIRNLLGSGDIGWNDKRAIWPGIVRLHDAVIRFEVYFKSSIDVGTNLGLTTM